MLMVPAHGLSEIEGRSNKNLFLIAHHKVLAYQIVQEAALAAVAVAVAQVAVAAAVADLLDHNFYLSI